MMDAEDELFPALSEQSTERERVLLEPRASPGSPQRALARQAWAAGDFWGEASPLRVAATDSPHYRGMRNKALVAGLAAPVLGLLPDRVPLRRLAKEPM